MKKSPAPASALCNMGTAGHKEAEKALGLLRGAEHPLLIGARFNWIFHFGLPPRFTHGIKVIQIDITPEEIGRNAPAAVGIVGDAKLVLAQLNEAWQENPVTHGETDA
jgi:thiamine pyrophosphate-dependent acetolactate synthase large subunit-like protein